MVNSYVYGLDPQSALNLPRLVPADGWVEMEPGFDPRVVEDLMQWGHRLKPADEPLGGGQIIQRVTDDTWIAGTDPRKDGVASCLKPAL
jgi:gamma-glutamyltranspeptidase / glutathione hydrolase